MSIIKATVTATFGRHFEVETEDGQLLIATRRGKRHDVTCNDQVSITQINEQEAVIEAVIEARNLFYRSDRFRQKTLAANIDQVIAVIANEPTFSDALLAHILIASDANHCSTIILHNKIDLPTSQRNQDILEYYAALNYTIMPISAKTEGVATLLPLLENKTSLLVGQSGMGKSTIINQLLPQQPARTNDISLVLDSGKHTTTFTRRYALNAQSFLIDSPGLQEFGLHHLSSAAFETLFREFNPLIGQCRFHNCQHINEPQCAFKTWAEEDAMKLRRLNLLIELQQASHSKT